VAELPAALFSTYKVLELIILKENTESADYRQSNIQSLENVKRWLTRISCIPFFPSPRKLLYVSDGKIGETFLRLLEISAIFSIPLFKVRWEDPENSPTVQLSPMCCDDLESVEISSTDKAALTAAFKGKRVWICYDGRSSVLDFACLLASVSSVDLTVLCESERFMFKARRDLAKGGNRNYKIKIFDNNLLKLLTPKPDVFFYNMPFKYGSSSEENMKEALVKNVLDTKSIIAFAKTCEIPVVFVLSSSMALNARNWVGATQRLGELFAQFADSQSKRKIASKFKVIRIPENVADIFDIWESSVFFSEIGVDYPWVKETYRRRDILQILVRVVSSLMRSNDSTSSVYTLIPKNSIPFDVFAEDLCKLYNLRNGVDAKIRCAEEEEEEKDLFSISETLEKTSISCVFRTKFLCRNASEYESFWTLKEIENMSTRELISSVFQSLASRT
jgi:hypothetical protein